MLQCFNADLHIHTCLSPCGDLLMSPKRVVEKAAENKIDIIAICDHNSAENVQAAINVGADYEITILAGMEITSVEEAHILALFDNAEAVLDLQKKVYENLAGENNEKVFGEQIIANEFDEVEGYNKRLLIGATALTIKTLVDEIHKRNGLAIAAHVDRQSFSIISQLGFIPPDLELDALEISANINRSLAAERFPEINKFPLITSSDAHFLRDIGKAKTSFLLKEPTFNEMKKALILEDGRKVLMEEA
jgi:predicted metal-dependent phosphoesterase TrpH